ncbi:MAG: DUF255 domain-containing protein [Bacteroidetes bacterium]|nr:DUF255 domain-containing protein [Bacteroidota bacterium]
MKLTIILISAWLPGAVFGQSASVPPLRDSTSAGIRFLSGLSWQQIMSKAKAENKYIFLDCYATWCGPCKRMDSEVYPLKEVGDFYNARFISVKMQMDTSPKDDSQTKARYADANWLKNTYPIQGYPTLLYFTPDGKIVRDDLGAIDVASLINQGKNALDPKTNYYSLLKEYENGKRDMGEMAFLAQTARVLIQDTATSRKVSNEYILHLSKDNWMTPDNITFIRNQTKNSGDIGFRLIYKNSDKVNEIMKDDTYSQKMVSSVIYNEIIKPALSVPASNGSTKKDWLLLGKKISKEYGSYYANRTILGAKADLAAKQKDWADYAKYLDEFELKFGSKDAPGLDLHLNNVAWMIFLHGQNNDELKNALTWSERAVMLNPIPNWMDTYANILYKLGEKESAVRWEKIVLKLAPDFKDAQENLRKMESGTPTWTGD